MGHDEDDHHHDDDDHDGQCFASGNIKRIIWPCQLLQNLVGFPLFFHILSKVIFLPPPSPICL